MRAAFSHRLGSAVGAVFAVAVFAVSGLVDNWSGARAAADE
jgi:hypothetical protein